MQEKTTWLFELKDLSDDDFRHLQKKMKDMGHDVQNIEKRDAFAASRKGAGKFKDQLTDIRHEIPMLDRGLTLLASPLGMAAAAATGLGIVLHKANKAATEFNHTFLELKNLNLDKTEAQIERLRDKVLDTAFDSGMDSGKISTAFFDVQSATGKYGAEVEKIVSRMADFSHATKADFNTAVEGASKAVGIFGLRARDMDKFLESSAKTVQVGITTFDQLAKVQVEYAGAAAAANQGFDEANKLFAIFSKSAKSVDIAANLTKTAFEDLTKMSTVRGFERIGVGLFDAAGEMRNLDSVLVDLVPKMQELTDVEFAALKEDIGGSEGLRKLLDQLRIAGDDVLKTFGEFDKLDINIDDALKNAKDDAETLSRILDNKLNNQMIRLGESTMPIQNWWTQLKIDWLDAQSDQMEIYRYAFDSAYREQFNQEHEQKKAEEMIYSARENALDRFGENSLASKFGLINAPGPGTNRLALENEIKELQKQMELEGPMGKVLNPFQANAKLKGLQEALAEMKKHGSISPASTPSEAGAPSGGDSSKTAITGIEAVNKMRNVTVNINSLVQELRYYTEESGMSDQDIEQKMVELLVRAVRDAEIALN